MRVSAIYLRLLHTDVSPKSKKKNCTASDPSVDTSFRPSALSKVVGEAVKLWGLRYRRVLVSPALELLKHRRCDLSLEGIRGCDERMVRYLVDDSKKQRFMDTERPHIWCVDVLSHSNQCGFLAHSRDFSARTSTGLG